MDLQSTVDTGRFIESPLSLFFLIEIPTSQVTTDTRREIATFLPAALLLLQSSWSWWPAGHVIFFFAFGFRDFFFFHVVLVIAVMCQFGSQHHRSIFLLLLLVWYDYGSWWSRDSLVVRKENMESRSTNIGN